MRWQETLARYIAELLANWEHQKTVDVETEILKKTGELKYRFINVIESVDPECRDIVLQALAHLEAYIAFRKERRRFYEERRREYYNDRSYRRGGGRWPRRRW